MGKNLNKSTTLWALPLGATPPFHLLELTSKLIAIISVSCSKPESGKAALGVGWWGWSAGTDNADVASDLASRLLWLGSRSLGRQFLG